MKHRLNVIVLLTVSILSLSSVLSSVASADALAASLAPSLRSTCSLTFTVKGTDIQILIGHSKLTGKGLISCHDERGHDSSLPVRVKIGTPVLFPRFSFSPSLTVHGSAQDIQVPRDGAKFLLGDYLTVDVTAAFSGGIGKSLDLQGETNGLALKLKLDDVDGFGLAVGATRVTIFR